MCLLETKEVKEYSAQTQRKQVRADFTGGNIRPVPRTGIQVRCAGSGVSESRTMEIFHSFHAICFESPASSSRKPLHISMGLI